MGMRIFQYGSVEPPCGLSLTHIHVRVISVGSFRLTRLAGQWAEPGDPMLALIGKLHAIASELFASTPRERMCARGAKAQSILLAIRNRFRRISSHADSGRGEGRAQHGRRG